MRDRTFRREGPRPTSPLQLVLDLFRPFVRGATGGDAAPGPNLPVGPKSGPRASDASAVRRHPAVTPASQPFSRTKPPANTPGADHRAVVIGRSMGHPIDAVEFSRARRTLATFHRDPTSGRTTVRLHRAFESAPDTVLAAVGDYFRRNARKATRAKALGVLRGFVSDAVAANPELDPPRATSLRSEGRHHDLEPLAKAINRDWFGGALTARVTWGRGATAGAKAGATRRRRSVSLLLGSYDASADLVRIHPVLDRPDVPTFVLEAILYHEFLHAALPPERTASGRRSLHGAAFRARERQFPHMAAAEAWVAANLQTLARARHVVM